MVRLELSKHDDFDFGERYAHIQCSRPLLAVNDLNFWRAASASRLAETPLSYNLASGMALRSADLPEPRPYPTAIASDDFFYLLGGMSRHGDCRTITNTFWRWQLASKRLGDASIVIRTKIYPRRPSSTAHSCWPLYQ